MSGPSASTSGSTISSTLWAHLLTKDTTASGSGLKAGLASARLSAPAPADKAGTSVRILLHDTQATIEKFSERVDRLVSGAEDSHRKLIARNEEVSDEVERLVKRVIQEQVGRTETTLKSCIRDPAQAPALAELREHVSSSLDALNQKLEAVQNLVCINTQALQTIKDQQLQILTAIIPLLPMLQKVPLHIASTETNLKEAIRKFVVAPTVASTQPSSTSPISDSRKRKLSKNAEQHSPSPSVTKRRRIRVDSGCSAQQLPSPKSSHDSLLTQNGLPTISHYPSVGGALHSASRSVSHSINTAKTPNPSQRPSIQPPAPRMVPATPSRTHSIALSDRTTQPTSSALPRKNETTSDPSVPPRFARPTSSITPVPPNHRNDNLKAASPFYIHTPLRTGSKHPNGWPTRPSALPPSSIGFSARRGKRFIPITDNDDDEIFDD